jgi:hypothetical protein
MPGLKNLPLINPKLSPKSALGNFQNKSRSVTSIAHQAGSTSSFHQFGDSVSRTQNNDRSGKIFGSISRAIKNKNNPDLPTNKNINQNFKPKI